MTQSGLPPWQPGPGSGITKIQIRRDTASNWSSVNPALAPGEFGYETDYGRLKIGKADSAGNPIEWNSLPYFSDGGQKGAVVLSDLLDTDVLSVNPGQYLKWDGTEWIPGDPVTGVNSKTGDVNLDAADVDAYTKAQTDALISGISFPVTSVNTKTGAVTLAAGDVGAYTKAETDAKVVENLEQDITRASDGEFSINADRITTEREAAQFLRNVTFGPTITELKDLIRLGSKRAWMLEQMAGSFDNSKYSEWSVIPDPGNPSGPAIYRRPNTGWFSGCASHFRLRNPDGTSRNYSFGVSSVGDGFPGPFTTYTMLHTAFIRNNPERGGIGSIRLPETTGGSGTIGAINPSTGVVNTLSLTTPIVNNTVTGGVDVTPEDRRAPTKSLLCKVTWILSKVFPVSTTAGGFFSQGGDGNAQVAWYSALSRFAFTTWAELLEEVTYSPSMAAMLTHLRNQKDNGTGRQPDENYAREIMQLFTIGLNERNLDGSLVLDANGNPIPTYDNDDVFQMARVFTGLTRSQQPDADYYNSSPSVEANMLAGGPTLTQDIAFAWQFSTVRLGTRKPATVIKKGERYRIIQIGNTEWAEFGAPFPNVNTQFVATKDGDPNSGNGVVAQLREAPVGVQDRLKHYIPWYEYGAKQALEKRDAPGQYHVDIPSGVDPETNIRLAIDGLVNHPSCAPNVALMLIRFSTTSNPSPGYVARVASVFRNNGRGVVGHLPSVWMAIFTDPEASNDINSSSKKGRVRDGWEMACNLLRSLDGHTPMPPKPAGPNEYKNCPIDGELNANQAVYGMVHVSSAFLNPNANQLGLFGTFPSLSPSVFGYYPQEYTVTPALDWGILVPELGSLPGNRLFGAQSYWNEVSGRNYNAAAPGGGVDYNAVPYLIDFAGIFDDHFPANATVDLVETLNLLLCGGALRPEKASDLVEFLDTMPISTKAEREDRVSMAVQLISYCPEFWIA
jgi:hypothetical protein